MRQSIRTVLISAALLAAAAPLAARADDDRVQVEKGVRFRLPDGFTVTSRQESEPGGDQDVVYVARKGVVEVRVEVEDGLLDCKELPDAAPRAGKTAKGQETCEAEAAGPPVLGERVVERRAAQVAVQFGAHHLSVIAFAADRAAALKLAREVAATGAEEK